MRMHTDNKGIGSRKHGRSGNVGHSPRFKHAMKREAEKTEIKDHSRIKDPSSSVNELMSKIKRQ